MSERVKTCYEVASRVSEKLRAEYPETEHYVLGGIATGAIADHSFADTELAVIIPAHKSDLAVTRENGTIRDIDILVRSDNPKVKADMAKLAIHTAADDMKVDVFGFDPFGMRRGLVHDLTKYWTSRREVTEDGRVMHVLLPCAAEIPESAFGPWAVRPDSLPDISILEPYYHLLCYDLRSIGGPRAKDQVKLEPVRELAHALTAENSDDMSAYADLVGMVCALQSLRAHNMRTARQSGELALLLKSRISGFAEKQEWVVDLFQKPTIQKIVRPFVGSQKAT